MTDSGLAGTTYAFRATTTSIGSKTRAITQAGPSSLVVDLPADDAAAANAGELFLGAITSCAVLMIVGLADDQGFPLTRVAGEIEAVADDDFDPDTFRTFKHARLTLTLEGVTEEQADSMAAEFRSRCPLYGTLALAVPDTELVVTTAR